MDKQEFLLLIPAIVYGVAIVDLLKIFSHKKNYIEMVGWGIFIITLVIFSWIELYNKLEVITSSNLSFFLIIGQAILLAKISAVITPEDKDEDTKEYFFKIRKTFFWLLSIATVYGFVLQYFVYDDHAPSWLKATAIIVYLSTAYSNKYWVRIGLLAIALTLAVLRVFTDVLV